MKTSILIATFSLGVFFKGAWADTSQPPSGFDSSRYSVLWSSSPFAVASTVISSDPGYDLVGLAQVDGISYACLIDKQKQEHFLLSSRSSEHGLALVSISAPDTSVRSAVIEKNGRLISLTVEATPFHAPSLFSVNSPAAMAKSPSAPPPMPCPPRPHHSNLPLLFQTIDPGVTLNTEQQNQIDVLRQNFIDALGPYPNPGDPDYVRRWQEAQTSSDEEVRSLLGNDLFSRFQLAALHPANPLTAGK